MDLVLTRGVAWPIAEQYTLDVERVPGLIDRDVRMVRSAGPVRSYWTPASTDGLADELATLAVSDDDAIYSWIQDHGYVGLHRDPTKGEAIEDIREATGHLARARALWRALADGRQPDELRELATAAAGHLVDVEHLARSTGFVRSAPAPGRAGAGADIQALHAMGVALSWPLQRWTWMLPVVQSTQRDMRLVADIVGSGPIGVAYLETLRDTTNLRIGHRAGVTRLDWKSQPRRCARCGVEFFPKRETQLYHDKRCRWAAQKATTRRDDQ